MRSAVAGLGFAMVLLGGCLEESPTPPSDVDVGPGPVGAYSFNGSSVDAFAEFDVVETDLGYGAAEPTVYAADANTALVHAIACDELPSPLGCRPYPIVLKVAPGNSPVRVSDAVLGIGKPPVTTDPLLVGHQLSGRVFFVNAQQPCAFLAYTDDVGATWTDSVFPCGSPGLNDHPTVAMAEAQNPDGASALLCFSQAAAISCASSTNGGSTWNPQRLVVSDDPSTRPGIACAPLTGHLHAAVNGFFLPTIDCSVAPRQPVIHWTGDLGITWTTFRPPFDAPLLTNFHDVAVTGVDPFYVTWIGEDGLTWLTSFDMAGNWQKPVRITAPATTAVWYNALNLVGDGLLAVAYLASDAAGGYASPALRTVPSAQNPNPATWHLFLSVVDLAGGEVQTVKLTAQPVARGLCGMTQCVPLGDFIGITSRDDAIWVPVVDGCWNSCATNDEEPMRDSKGLLFQVTLTKK